MTNIEFFCSKCTSQEFKRNYQSVDNLEILKNIVNSNYCTIILYDISCEDCKNIGDNLSDSKYAITGIWHGFIRKFGVYIKNKEYVANYGLYILKNNKIYKDLAGLEIEISEEIFLDAIKDGSVFSRSDNDKIQKFPHDAHDIYKSTSKNPGDYGYIGQEGIRGMSYYFCRSKK